MGSVTEKQKNIYNKHLAISRQSRNKPFKIKKNFSDIDATTQLSLIKIERLLSKFPNIDLDVYFKAPFSLWKDTEYFPLEYFATQAALRAFSLYKKQLLEQNIDSNESLDEIKSSLMFICKFCISNDITLDQYIIHKSGITYSWSKHIQNASITPYVMFGFNNIDKIIFNIPEDESEYMLGTFKEKFYVYKNAFNKSTTAKHTIIEGLKKIKKWISEKQRVEITTT